MSQVIMCLMSLRLQPVDSPVLHMWQLQPPCYFPIQTYLAYWWIQGFMKCTSHCAEATWVPSIPIIDSQIIALCACLQCNTAQECAWNTTESLGCISTSAKVAIFQDADSKIFAANKTVDPNKLTPEQKVCCTTILLQLSTFYSFICILWK